MSAPELQILDLSEPVVVSMMAIVHFVHDEDLVHRVLATLMEPLPAGSFLALSAVTNDNAGDSGSEALGRSQAGGMPIKNRSHDEVQDLFRGLELLEPGVVLVHRWHPDEQAAALADDEVHLYGGVAVKR